MPNSDAASKNKPKLDWFNAHAAIETAATADNDAEKKPLRRPILRINNAAGTVDAAVPRIARVIGNVDQAMLVVRLAPIIEPRVTNTMDPVAEIS